MGMKNCAWCSNEIDGKGVEHAKQFFCSDECLDDYQDDIASKGETDLEDIDENLDAAVLEEVDFGDAEYLDEDLDDDIDYAMDDY